MMDRISIHVFVVVVAALSVLGPGTAVADAGSKGMPPCELTTKWKLPQSFCKQ